MTLTHNRDWLVNGSFPMSIRELVQRHSWKQRELPPPKHCQSFSIRTRPVMQKSSLILAWSATMAFIKTKKISNPLGHPKFLIRVKSWWYQPTTSSHCLPFSCIWAECTNAIAVDCCSSHLSRNLFLELLHQQPDLAIFTRDFDEVRDVEFELFGLDSLLERQILYTKVGKQRAKPRQAWRLGVDQISYQTALP